MQRIIDAKPEVSRRITIGFQGENLVRKVRFEKIKGMVSQLLIKRKTDASSYPVELEDDGEFLVWNVTSTDTWFDGVVRAEVIYTQSEKIEKSDVFYCIVEPSIEKPSENPPEPISEWYRTFQIQLDMFRQQIDEKMSFYECTVRNGAIYHGDERLDYNRLGELFESPKHFLYMRYLNLIFIPSFYVGDDGMRPAIEFSASWIYGTPTISRVIINDENIVKYSQISIEDSENKVDDLEWWEMGELPACYPTADAVVSYVGQTKDAIDQQIEAVAEEVDTIRGELIKTSHSHGLMTADDGSIVPITYSKASFDLMSDSTFVSKGTLMNVLNAILSNR